MEISKVRKCHLECSLILSDTFYLLGMGSLLLFMAMTWNPSTQYKMTSNGDFLHNTYVIGFTMPASHHSEPQTFGLACPILSGHDRFPYIPWGWQRLKRRYLLMRTSSRRCKKALWQTSLGHAGPPQWKSHFPRQEREFLYFDEASVSRREREREIENYSSRSILLIHSRELEFTAPSPHSIHRSQNNWF